MVCGISSGLKEGKSAAVIHVCLAHWLSGERTESDLQAYTLRSVQLCLDFTRDCELLKSLSLYIQLLSTGAWVHIQPYKNIYS